MSEKIDCSFKDYSLSDVISILKTRCKLLQNCQPYDYRERIEFNQVIIKYLMELQKYREQEQEEEWHRQVMEEMTIQQLMEQEPELYEV